MTSKNQMPAGQCPAAGCTRTVEQKQGSGRIRIYCSAACGSRHRQSTRKHPKATANENNDFTEQTLRRFLTQAGQVAAHTRDGDPAQAVARLLVLLDDALDLRGALIQQAYDKKVKSAELSALVHHTTETLNRWREHGARARVRDLTGPTEDPRNDTVTATAKAAGSGGVGALSIPGQRHPEPAPAPPPRAAGGSPGLRGLTLDTPAATFTSAMSHLQRESGLTFSALGEAIGVDRSYISRVVTGERIPTWKVTRAFAQACNADPDDLRPLWDAARGYRVAEPATFHAALRGIHLSTGHLDIETLRARSGHRLTENEITGLLRGTLVPEWHVVDALIHAMRAQPDTIEPLWQAAHTDPQHRPAAQRGNVITSFPASAFG